MPMENLTESIRMADADQLDELEAQLDALQDALNARRAAAVADSESEEEEPTGEPTASKQNVYPTKLKVNCANGKTVQMIRDARGVKTVGEIGVYRGHTSVAIGKILAKRGGTLHLFDFPDMLAPVAEKVRATGCTVVEHPNERKVMSSYNWSLMKLLKKHGGASFSLFDYVFIDGSHIWDHDALAFFLVDRLLKKNGFLDFDDYRWTMGKSDSVGAFAGTRERFPAEQLDVPHVKLVVDLLVKTNKRYKQVHASNKNQIFRKVI